jgi:hypothetical protein
MKESHSVQAPSCGQRPVVDVDDHAVVDVPPHGTPSYCFEEVLHWFDDDQSHQQCRPGAPSQHRPLRVGPLGEDSVDPDAPRPCVEVRGERRDGGRDAELFPAVSDFGEGDVLIKKLLKSIIVVAATSPFAHATSAPHDWSIAALVAPRFGAAARKGLSTLLSMTNLMSQ